MAILNNALVRGTTRCLNKAWFNDSLEVSGATTLHAVTATTGTFTGAITGTSATFSSNVKVTSPSYFEGALKNSLAIYSPSDNQTPIATYNNSSAISLTLEASTFGGANAEDSVYWVQGGSTTSTDGDWTGFTPDQTLDLYHGMKIMYMVGWPGSDDETVRGSAAQHTDRNLTALNINGKGWVQVYYANYRSGNTEVAVKPVTTEYNIGQLIQLVYHYNTDEAGAGAQENYKGWWQVLADYDSNDPDYQTREYNATRIAGNAINAYKLCVTGSDGKLYSLVTGTQSEDGGMANKTPITTSFYPNQIYYYGATTAVTQNNMVAEGTLYSQHGKYDKPMYTFNSRLPINSIIFLKGTYNATTGLFTLDGGGTAGSTAWYASIKESNGSKTGFAENKYYILLGETGDAAAIEGDSNYNGTQTYKMNLYGQHPIFYYDGTNLLSVSVMAHRLFSTYTVANRAYTPIYLDSSGFPQKIVDTNSNDIIVQKSVPSSALLTDTLNTAGTTSHSLAAALYMVGTTSVGPASYVTKAASGVFVTDGNTVNATKIKIGDITLSYNTNNSCLDFLVG